jgi:hypothetical protein
MSYITPVILFRLQQLRETGVIQKLHEDTMRYRPRTEEAALKSVELLDVAPVLNILASGILVAVFLVFLERHASRKRQKNCSNNNICDLAQCIRMHVQRKGSK